MDPPRHATNEERDRCLSEDLAAHLTKPVDVRALDAMLDQWMAPPRELNPSRHPRAEAGTFVPT